MARHRGGSDPWWVAGPFPFWKAFRDDLVGLGLLGAGSICVGLTVNGLRAHPLALGYTSPKIRLGQVVTRMPDARLSAPVSDDFPVISLDEFQEMVFAPQGVSIDARPRAFYEAGHVPGALNLPREDFANSYAAVRASLQASQGEPIVVYCAEADCQDSELVAGALSRLGFRHVRIYKAGWEEWLRAGLPKETTAHPR